jgi:signal transduction histidine kinase
MFADTLLAGLLLVIGLNALLAEPDADLRGGRLVVMLLLTGSMFVALIWRRRSPRAVLAAIAMATITIWLMDEFDGTTAVAGTISLYGLGRYVERPRSLQAYTVSSVALVVVALLTIEDGPTQGWIRFVSRCGIVLGPFWLGDSQRARSALTASYQERALRAEAARSAEARRAVIDERARIARELHDVVAHSVSIMVVQSAVAQRLSAADPAKAQAAIANVAQVGRSALTEMRRIIDVLDGGESEHSERAPQPGLADLDVLIERCRGAGLNVTFERIGEPPVLSAGTELSLYRLVQESLTNVMKHAGAAETVVRLNFDNPIVIEVADNGRGAAASATDGLGRGLIGMRERVTALHGTFAAGPKPGGGYLVRATVPVSRDAVA